MKPTHAIVLTLALLAAAPARAAPPAEDAGLTAKLNAYVGCINRLSGRAYESRSRYFSWAAKSGPTGKERIVYGTYTIYDTKECRESVTTANTLEPHDADLEAAASAYAAAVSELEPLLKEADNYYDQQNYKDDRMAKGKALHQRLVWAWDAFAIADQKLRAGVEAINDKRAADKLAEIERAEGRTVHYNIEAMMVHAKRVVRAQESDKPDLDVIAQALGELEGAVKTVTAAAGKDSGMKIGSIFVGSAQSFLVTAKQAMRRIRDKVPYSAGERMILNSSGGGWMVEGSPQRLLRDYNGLIDSYNRGVGI